MEQEGSVPDDAPGITPGVGGGGQPEQLDIDFATHSVAQQAA